MDDEGAAGGADPYRERGRRSSSRLLIDSYLVRCPDVNRSPASGSRYEVPCRGTKWPVAGGWELGTGGEARIHASEGRPRWEGKVGGKTPTWVLDRPGSAVVDRPFRLPHTEARRRPDENRVLEHGCGGVVGGGMRVGGARVGGAVSFRALCLA